MERMTEHALVAKLINQIEAGNTAPELIKEYSQYILLAAYENTGLKPSEVADMQAENAKLHELLKSASEDIRKMLTSEYGSECQFCCQDKNENAMCRKLVNGSGGWCCGNAKWQHADEVEEVLADA